jgi:hypothetical protein
VVRTDHYSLKFILDQRLSAIPQHTWVSKLFGYDFIVEYRPGRLNIAADALSRCEEVEVVAHSISSPTFELFDTLRMESASDPQVAEKRAQITAGTAPAGWTVNDGFLLFKGKLFVPDASSMWPVLLAEAHDGGHEGVEKTLHRWRASFYSPLANRKVREFMKGCAVCQRNKSVHLHPVGLLQPLLVPSAVWSDISMDFVEGFPKAEVNQ